MTLKIKKTTGEVFDLSPDYKVESEKTNPIFTGKGSQTVPIEFPATEHNKKLTGHVGRLDKREKPDDAMRVLVESDAIQQAGLLKINSASSVTVSANIGWDESEMYAAMGETLLKDLPSLPVYTPAGNTLEERVDALLAHLTLIMKLEFEETNYSVFPICLKQESIQPIEGEKTYYEILNDINPNVQGIWADLLALENRVVTRLVDGVPIQFDVPKGYGVSPFIKVWRLLELIFENYNLKIERNPFKEDRQLKKLVVLNNTMDTILPGFLSYKDLMPDMTVKEFLEALYATFGMKYFVNSNLKTVDIFFLEEIFSSPRPQKDFSDFKTAPLEINYYEPKQIKIICNREIEGTETNHDSFEEFLQAYDYGFIDSNDSRFNGLYYNSIFNVRSRLYYQNNYNSTDLVNISSDFFDWDRKAELPYEEINRVDLCLPVQGNPFSMPAYWIGTKHAYSIAQIGNNKIETNQDITKLAFVFGWGKTAFSENSWIYFFASQDNRDANGNFIFDQSGEKYSLSLTCHREDGLFNRFWKSYDAFLRHSNNTVEGTLKIPLTDVLNLKMHEPVSVDNQPLLPEEIKFNLNSLDGERTCKFRTLRLYHPYDLESEHKIEAYHPQKYYWKREVIKSSDTEEWLADQGVFPTVSGHTLPENDGRYAIIQRPPTQEDYTNGNRVVFEYDYEITWQTPDGINGWEEIHATATYIPTLIPV